MRPSLIDQLGFVLADAKLVQDRRAGFRQGLARGQGFHPT
jgi:hypothetical protein